MTKANAIVTDSGRVVSLDVLDQYAANKASSRQIDESGFSELTNELFQPKYNPGTLAGVLELNTVHARCCKVKANDVAGHGWTLQGVKNGDEEPDVENRRRIENFIAGLQRPVGGKVDLRENALVTIIKRAQLDYESTGYAALEVVRRDDDPDGEPVQLVHVPSATLRLHKDRRKFVQSRHGKRVWFKAFGFDADVHYRTGEVRPKGTLDDNKRATEILFWSNYSPSTAAHSAGAQVYGLPDHVPALGAIHGDRARMSYNLDFFENFGVPAYLVTISGDFDPGPTDEDGKTELDKKIEAHFKTLRENPHANLVLTIPTREGAGEEGKVEVKFEPVSVEVKEASFRLFRRDNNTEVLNAHGVPAARVGAFEAGAANREASEVYKRSVIDDRQREVEIQINLLIREAFGIVDWEFRLTELDNRDESHDLDMLTKLHAVEAVTAGEIRAYFAARFNLDPDAVPEPAADASPQADVEAVLRSLKDDVAEMARKEYQP